MPQGHGSSYMKHMENHLAMKLGKPQCINFRASHKQQTVINGYAIDGWHQIRIFLDIKFAGSFIVRNPEVQSRYGLHARLIQSVRKYFQNNLSVNYYYMYFRGGNCPELAIPRYIGFSDL